MLSVTITVAALLAVSYLGYLTYEYKNAHLDSQAKYEASKKFADSAAKRILDLESNRAEMSKEIVKLVNELETFKKVQLEKEAEREAKRKAAKKKKPKSSPVVNKAKN